MACDFLHAGTVLLQRLQVLFMVEIQARAVHIAASLRIRPEPWATQQARNLLVDLGGRASGFRFLIRDARLSGCR